MKKTGDDELDFIREGSSWVLNRQAKMFGRYVLPSEIFAAALLTGAVALLSTTVALWVMMILGALLTIQVVLFAGAQFAARRFIKQNTISTEALDKVTRGFFE